MLIFTRSEALTEHINLLKNNKLKIGFVPTMGALHAGHLSLVKACNACCDVSVCSIFVNPRQFNDPEDLKRYPRTPEKDRLMLEEANCSILFLPDVNELYQDQENERYNFGTLDEVLEARHRPGHFNGVAQVLRRFFVIVMPDMAFFGQKDFQQLLIVKALVKSLNLNIEVVSCPIERETDGLAMSSRNTLLSAHERKIASRIPELMMDGLSLLKVLSLPEVLIKVKENIQTIPEMKLDYFEVCNPETLLPLKLYKPEQGAIALIAVYVGKIRLIDNVLLPASALKV